MPELFFMSTTFYRINNFSGGTCYMYLDQIYQHVPEPIITASVCGASLQVLAARI